MESEQIQLSELLQCLVECSQKAAKIAQIFRAEDSLFEILVEVKSEAEKNERFLQDFKTLADVLVQETIKKDVGEKYPSLIPHIQGEEQNNFTNSHGDKITVELSSCPDKTEALLNKVLDGRDHIAKSLATVVHSTDVTCCKQCSSELTISSDSIGIWIDPIDATSEYIRGEVDWERNDANIQTNGLACAVVLIGVYDKKSGSPIMGVVNQPFSKKNSGSHPKWESNFYWGIDCSGINLVPESLQNESMNESIVVVLSYSETRDLQDYIASKYTVVCVAGAGHKLLQVICKKADFFIQTRDTSYFWDACGPHALLKSIGGGMVKLSEALKEDTTTSTDLLENQLRYLPNKGKDGNKAFQNVGGFIAYRDSDKVLRFLDFLRSCRFSIFS